MIRPDLIEHVIRPVDPGAVRRRRLRRAASTRPASSCSAARTPTPASPAARSSSTPTAAWPATAAAPSAARTRPRSTARPPTPPAGWPSTWSPSGAASRCEVQVAYAIGVAQPVSILVETFGTETVDAEAHRAGRPGRVRPAAARPSSATSTCASRSTASTAAYGHFGRDEPGFTWEQLGNLDELQVGARACATRAVGSPRGPGRPRRAGARQGVRLPGPGRAPATRSRVGTLVRVPLPGGGSVAGWWGSTLGDDRRTAIGAAAAGQGHRLGTAAPTARPGPWAAWRWAGGRCGPSCGRRRRPPCGRRRCPHRPRSGQRRRSRSTPAAAPSAGRWSEAVVRLPPAADPVPVVLAAVPLGPDARSSRRRSTMRPAARRSGCGGPAWPWRVLPATGPSAAGGADV